MLAYLCSFRVTGSSDNCNWMAEKFMLVPLFRVAI